MPCVMIRARKAPDAGRACQGLKAGKLESPDCTRQGDMAVREGSECASQLEIALVLKITHTTTLPPWGDSD